MMTTLRVPIPLQMPTTQNDDDDPEDLGLRILDRQTILKSVDEEVGDGSLQLATPVVAKTIAAANRQFDLSKVARSVTAANRLLASSHASSQIARSVTAANRLLASSLASSQIARSVTAANRLLASSLASSQVWFPHSTFPRHLLNWNGDETYSDEMVLTHYRKNWSTVRHVIGNELANCDVDFDAKEALYKYSIGEFFQLYGQFERKYQLTKHDKTKAKMEALLNGNQKYLKPFYTNRGLKLYPLPLAVRHILAHSGNNPNTLDQEGEELRRSIELLQSWVSRKK